MSGVSACMVELVGGPCDGKGVTFNERHLGFMEKSRNSFVRLHVYENDGSYWGVTSWQPSTQQAVDEYMRA